MEQNKYKKTDLDKNNDNPIRKKKCVNIRKFNKSNGYVIGIFSHKLV